jgi:hypothetical protein
VIAAAGSGPTQFVYTSADVLYLVRAIDRDLGATFLASLP